MAWYLFSGQGIDIMKNERIRFCHTDGVWSPWFDMEKHQPLINSILIKAELSAVETHITMTKEEYLEFMDKF